MGHFLDSRVDDGVDVHRKSAEFIRLANILGFVSWGVIQMLLHGSFGLIRQPSMEQPPGL